MTFQHSRTQAENGTVRNAIAGRSPQISSEPRIVRRYLAVNEPMDDRQRDHYEHDIGRARPNRASLFASSRASDDDGNLVGNRECMGKIEHLFPPILQRQPRYLIFFVYFVVSEN
jgi:hypothetical protein